MGWDGTEGVYSRSDWVKVFLQGLRIVRRKIVNGTYYLAISDENNNIYGAVVAFEKGDDCILGKFMSERIHPYYYDCPKDILNLLSPTEDKLALAWRENCRKAVQ